MCYSAKLQKSEGWGEGALDLPLTFVRRFRAADTTLRHQLLPLFLVAANRSQKVISIHLKPPLIKSTYNNDVYLITVQLRIFLISNKLIGFQILMFFRNYDLEVIDTPLCQHLSSVRLLYKHRRFVISTEKLWYHFIFFKMVTSLLLLFPPS